MKATEAERVAANVAFEDLLDVAELRDILLIASKTSASPEAQRHRDDAWVFEQSCEVMDVFYDPDRKALVGMVEAVAACRLKRKRIAKVAARYVAIYSVEGRPDQAVAERFFKAVGKVAVYPYFRNHFAATAAQAGFHFPPLPILKTPRRAIAAWAKEAPKPSLTVPRPSSTPLKQETA